MRAENVSAQGLFHGVPIAKTIAKIYCPADHPLTIPELVATPPDLRIDALQELHRAASIRSSSAWAAAISAS
jgi:hypothetical protein